jgi:hypothetical protein
MAAWYGYDDALGKVNKSERWNLTSLCGMVLPPPTIWLADLGYDDNCLPALARITAWDLHTRCTGAIIPGPAHLKSHVFVGH